MADAEAQTGRSPDAADRFDGLLLPGETIVWCGRPAKGIMFGARDALLIPFSLFWCGFAIFWEAGVASANAPVSFRLFGVPFVAIGLFFVFGRFQLDAWLRARTVYAVTDRRIMILRWGSWPSIRTLGLDRLPGTTLRGTARGTGTIRFGARAETGSASGGSFGSMVPSLDPTPQFLAIDDARSVFAEIQRRSHPPG